MSTKVDIGRQKADTIADVWTDLDNPTSQRKPAKYSASQAY